LGTLSKRTIIILLHVVHWFLRWQHRCCRASSELGSNYLFNFLHGAGYNQRFSLRLLFPQFYFLRVGSSLVWRQLSGQMSNVNFCSALSYR